MEPEVVDYFSHKFNQTDLHQNWKTQTKTKQIRLENLTWRRFFKTHFSLKTVDPKTIDWDRSGWLFAPLVEVEKNLDLINSEKKSKGSLKKMAKCIKTLSMTDEK
jgi:hypothetical protein